jgi:diguanylate cyclase (GGDEF)-like protein/PAS domain S-box-containing protein
MDDSTLLSRIYKSLFKYNPDASYAIDINGKFILMNDKALQTTGYSSEELLQCSFVTLLREDYVEFTLEIFTRVLKGNRESFELSILDKSGKSIDLYITAVPIFFEGEVIGIAGIAKDITEFKKMQKRLFDSNNQLQNIFNSVDICIWSKSADDNQIFQISPACQGIYGYSQSEFLKNPILWQESVHPLDRAVVEEKQQLLFSGGPIRHEYRIIDASGNVKWVRDHTFPTLKDSGELERIDGVIIDITKRKDAEESLRYMAYHDPLTKLPNRSFFKSQLNKAIENGKKTNSKVAVLYLDLDNFKMINDTLGHDAGDKLLKNIGDRLKDGLRQNEFVSRQGGDEFAVILNGIIDKNQLVEVGQRLSEIVAEPLSLNGREFRLTASIGVSIFPTHCCDSDGLIQRADQAMYRAKQNGKGLFQFYQSGMNQALSRRMELEQGLRKALSLNEFTLHYQPIVDTQSSMVIGFEALLRWKHSKLGHIPPEEFIPIAEESGLIIPIGEWVLQTACLQIKHLQQIGQSKSYISVNVSAKQLNEDHFIPNLTRLLKKIDFDPQSLKIEITESTMMKEIDQVASRLNGLAKLGIDILLDDFGTGYSSLRYLQRLPIKILKIDRSFVQDINKNLEQEAIIKTIVAMANNLRMGIIAEGVEQKYQQLFLEELGCFNIQGYLYSRPVQFEQVIDLVKNKICGFEILNEAPV